MGGPLAHFLPYPGCGHKPHHLPGSQERTGRCRPPLFRGDTEGLGGTKGPSWAGPVGCLEPSMSSPAAPCREATAAHATSGLRTLCSQRHGAQTRGRASLSVSIHGWPVGLARRASPCCPTAAPLTLSLRPERLPSAAAGWAPPACLPFSRGRFSCHVGTNFVSSVILVQQPTTP